MDLGKINLIVFAGFYLFAGVNHFINPSFYIPLIPDYLPYPEIINILSGIIEIALAIIVLFEKTRKLSSILVALMLIAFIPSHIHFIMIGSCVDDGLCVSPWIGWFRLLVIHPLLLFWAYRVYSA